MDLEKMTKITAHGDKCHLFIKGFFESLKEVLYKKIYSGKYK